MQKYLVSVRVVKYVQYVVTAPDEYQAEWKAEEEAYLEYGTPSDTEATAYDVEEVED